MIKRFGINSLGKDYVVGDIHGCFTLLSQTLQNINFNVKTDRLFSVGDLVDRGTQSEDCIKWLNKSWFHAVRGNHEQMAIEYTPYAKDIYRRNGGQWFINLTEQEQLCYQELFNQLPYVIEVETIHGLIGIIHADCPFDDWNNLPTINNKECLLWDRSRFEHKDTSGIQNIHKVYFGHTPSNEITHLGNCTYIDTGAVFTGKLTIMEI